jgi:hypothetical protein
MAQADARGVERRYKMLQEEHEILKKAIRLLPKEDRNLPIHRSKPGAALDRADVPVV